ncbi:MAG: alpha/beta fold hydrolase [Pseudomonadota bacterium]
MDKHQFHKIIRPLTDPASYGGDPEDAFHLVCPSMPGYGFSDAPSKPGFNIRSVAETNIKLMAKLGYSRYGAQGGDWGAIATAWNGHLDPEHVCGIHMNMIVATPPEGVENPMEGLSPEEMGDVASIAEFTQKETGYQQIQGSKPQTLGYGLMDSPSGLAGWIVEKFRTWSDCNGNVENRFTKDELLTNIMIYWVTGSITSSTRLYCETSRAGLMAGGMPQVTVPTGAAIFPKEIYRAPRAWAANHYNIQHWNRYDSGGHFAALEEPDTLVEDVRTFFRALR